MIPAPFPVIGVVRSNRSSLENTPIQAALNRSERGFAELDPRYADGLDGLEGFDYAWLLTWLHNPHDRVDDAPPLRQVPFLLRRTGRRVGIFATRGPRRVNPIGLSLIQVIAVGEGGVEFAGVDVIDGTPIVDLKPYVERFDRPPTEPRCGWFDDVRLAEGITPSMLEQPDP
jgi:tRNA (adenine37-N6)-methyltransferase